MLEISRDWGRLKNFSNKSRRIMKRSRNASKAKVPVIPNHLFLYNLIALIIARQTGIGLLKSNRDRAPKKRPDHRRSNPFIITRILIYLAKGIQCLINFLYLPSLLMVFRKLLADSSNSLLSFLTAQANDSSVKGANSAVRPLISFSEAK